MQVLRDLDAFVPVCLCGQGEQSPSRHYPPVLPCRLKLLKRDTIVVCHSLADFGHRMFLSFLLFLYFTIILFQDAIYKIVIPLQPLVNDGIDLMLFNGIAFVHELAIMFSRSRSVL